MVQIETLISRPVKISPDECSALVSQADREVFRLETLDSYNVPWDEVMLPQYLSGQSLPTLEDPRWTEWFADIKTAASSGMYLKRVHIVPEVLTPYLRYEIEWGYQLYNQPSGEKVYIAVRDDKLHMALNEDFQLIDDRSLIYVRYNSDNSWAGFEREQNQVLVASIVRQKNSLLNSSIPLSEFLASMRNTSLTIARE